MGRAAVWTVAGTALGAAVVLTLFGVGDDANALPNWQALVLGLVQGATELLPISSSGHLILVPWLGDWEYLKEHDAFNQTFDVSLHLGTLLAVFAGLLWVADRRPQQKRMEDVGLRAAVGVGLAQTLSLMPGVSRSGITITAGRLLGLDRDSAARFSFLLLVPITLGAVLYKGVGDVLLADLPDGMTGPFVVGSAASFASALVAITALLGYVRRHDYSIFVWYRLLVAAIVLLLVATGVRAAGF